MNINRTEQAGVIDVKLTNNNGQQVGFGTWVVDEWELSIDRISVNEPYRWQGLATIIEEQMEQIATNIGAKSASTLIEPNNVASQRVHQKGGYQIKSNQETWWSWRPERFKKL